MSTWLIPENDLTPEQLRAVELDPKEHRLILGGPGSGKTQVLLHRANYLRAKWRVSPGRYQIFVFTKALKEYIKSSLDLLGLPANCVTNFDAWCADYYQSHVGGRLPWNKVDKQPDFGAIRKAVWDDLSTSLFPEKPYDFILVDEGQDLDALSFDILRMISRHVTVCMDHKQQIYDRGSSEAEVLKRLGLRKRNMAFLEVFRGCPYVAHLSARFIDDLEEREHYLRQTKTAQVEREHPLLYFAQDFEDERSRLLDVLRTRVLKGDRVAILLPQQRQVYGFAKGLEEAGLEVETPKNINFDTDLPKLMPYHSAKGLTFDSVLMPRLVTRSFPKASDERIMRLLFVGTSRATQWVYMSATMQDAIPSLERLKVLASEGLLTIQDQLTPVGQHTEVKLNRSDEADDLLDIL